MKAIEMDNGNLRLFFNPENGAYLIGYNNDSCFVTPEPLGPGGDPYPVMNSKPDPASLDKLVMNTADYFREREQALLAE